jgi:hypothetical protein
VWASDQPIEEERLPSKQGSKKLMPGTAPLSRAPHIHWSLQLLVIAILAASSFHLMFEASLLSPESGHKPIDRLVLQIKPSFEIESYALAGSLFALGSCAASLSFYLLLTLGTFLSQVISVPQTFALRLTVAIRCSFLILTTSFAIIYIQFSALPLNGIKVDLHPYLFSQVVAVSQTREVSSLSLFSGYGLFRTMAGVGQLNETEKSSVYQIGGRYPSIVARHELVLEGYDLDTERWILIPFKYLPSRTTLPPRWVFPHQPRLDWHMGFAAHSSYQHHPWLVMLIYRLLQGNQESVISLLDKEGYPFHNKPPILIRCILYEYDLTRLDTYWNRNSPSPDGVLTNLSFWSPISHLWKSDESFHWWHRRRLLGEYLTPLHLTNPSLKVFLEGNGHQVGSDPDPESSQCVSTALPNHPLALDGICRIIFWVRTHLTDANAWSGFKAILVVMITRRILSVLELN